MVGTRRITLLRWLVCVGIAALAAGLLGGCGAIASALPPRPSPFPTLARLPTVTPMLPTAIPSPTLPLPSPTATPIPLTGIVASEAVNVRAGPGVGFPVLLTLARNDEVTLQGQYDGWYQVLTPDRTLGWISAQVLDITPETAQAVPTVTP